MSSPRGGAHAILSQLKLETREAASLGVGYIRRGRLKLTQREIEQFMDYFRCQMKMVQALAMVKGEDANSALEELAFRPGNDSTQFNRIVASFQLWDWIGINAMPAILAVGSVDIGVRNRAEWMLVQAGPAVLLEVRKALHNENQNVRECAVRIVAWQGDNGSVKLLE